MTLLGIAQILIFFVLVLAVTKPAGVFMYNVFEGKRTFLHPVLRPLERAIYWLGGVREDIEQTWVGYAASLIAFSFFCFLFPYVLQRLQGFLPFNPMHFSTGQAPAKRHADDSGSGIQYRRQLHDEYQLAVVFAGYDDELLRADGGSRRPELCVRRSGNCRRHRSDSRLRAAHDEDNRKFLGGCHPLHRLHPAAAFRFLRRCSSSGRDPFRISTHR